MINLTLSIVLINTCHQPNFNFRHLLQRTVTSSITSVLVMQQFRRLCDCCSSRFTELKIRDNLLMICYQQSSLQDFLNGKVQDYIFQDVLWEFMAVYGAESVSSRFKKSVISDLGYRTFSCCCLGVLSECLACLLRYRSTSKYHLIHFWRPKSWRLQIRSATRSVGQQPLEEGCKFWRYISPFSALLILPTVKSGPYHHGVKVVYSEKAIIWLVCILHRECYGTPRD